MKDYSMFKKILSSLFVCHLLFSPAVFAQEVKGGILKEGVKPAKEPITQEFKTTEKKKEVSLSGHIKSKR